MAVKYPLKMADGAEVKTLEELRKHFDMTAVLTSYDNGHLVKWLESGYYDEEAEKVAALDAASADFAKGLCAILGVEYLEDVHGAVDLDSISRRNERLNRLKQYTADDEILASIDFVAFTQNELAELLDQGEAEEVYLCGKRFTIPNVEDIVYIGVNRPTIRFKGNYIAAGIDVQCVEFDTENIGDCEYADNPTLYMKLLRIAAETGSSKAQRQLGDCYFEGQPVEKDLDEAIKWYEAAANQGSSIAEERFHACLRENMRRTADTFSTLGQMFGDLADEVDEQEETIIKILTGQLTLADDEDDD